MINLPSFLSLTAAGLLLVLAILHIARGTIRLQKTLFTISALILAAVEVILGFICLSLKRQG